jgi:Phage integrase family
VEIKLADSEPKAAIARKTHIQLPTRAVHLFPVVVFGGGQDSIGHIIVVDASGILDAGTLGFRSPEGAMLDPDNLCHRVFLPVLVKARIRKIRLHDLRHTFGSLLLQNGASIRYVKEEIGHSSIQVTADTYGHLIPDRQRRFC